MPDLTPSLALLKKLGLALPDVGPDITPERRRLFDKEVREKQSHDPIWKQYARQGVDTLANIPKGLAGIDPDPNESSGGYLSNALTQLGGASEGINTPLKAVSIFAGVPERMMAGRAFRKAAASTDMPIHISDALMNFENKYPRIAAHMAPYKEEISGVANAAAHIPEGKVTRPIRVSFTKMGENLARGNPEKANELVFHEGTHVAQALGNKNLKELYNNANDLTGYIDNPFEINARASGARNNSNSPIQNRKTININQNLSEISQNRLSKTSDATSQKIRGILKDRGIIKPFAQYEVFDPQTGKTIKYVNTIDEAKKLSQNGLDYMVTGEEPQLNDSIKKMYSNLKNIPTSKTKL